MLRAGSLPLHFNAIDFQNICRLLEPSFSITVNVPMVSVLFNTRISGLQTVLRIIFKVSIEEFGIRIRMAQGHGYGQIA